MSAPAVLATEEITQGESWTPSFVLTDGENAALDLSLATAGAVLRVSPRGAALSFSRTKGVVGESSFPTDGKDGAIRFLVASSVTLALAIGYYEVEVIYTDSLTTPATKVVHARGLLKVKAPKTGAI